MESGFGNIHQKSGSEILGSINNQVNLLYMVGQLSKYGSAGEAAKLQTQALLDRLTTLQDEMAKLVQTFDEATELKEVWRVADRHDSGMYTEGIVLGTLQQYKAASTV